MKTFFTLLCALFVVANGAAQSLWQPLGSGATALNANENIYALSAGGGNIYAAGDFGDSTVPNFNRYVAMWNGSAWTKLGTGANAHFNGRIYCLATDAAGNVYTAGEFSNGAFSTTGKHYVAKWDGTSWTELGGANALAANDVIYALTVDAANNVYAAGRFTNGSGKRYVAKWNGTAWSEPGAGSGALNANERISAIAVDGSGNIYAGGMFTDAATYSYGGPVGVFKYDGSTWSRLGTVLKPSNSNSGSVTSIAVGSGGIVYVAGRLGSNFGLDTVGYAWNGSTWTSLGGTGILDHLVFNNGYAYASGVINNSASGARANVFRWTGTAWIPLQDTLAGSTNPTFVFNALAMDAGGAIYATGGYIGNSGGYYVARNAGFSSGVGVAAAGKANATVSITPNPGSGVFRIRSDGAIKSVRVFDALGRIVSNQSSNFQIDLSRQQAAAYVVCVETADGLSYFRLVKE